MSKHIYIPILAFGAASVALFIGGSSYSSLWRSKEAKQQSEKFREVLEYVDRNYVDEVDLPQFTEIAIEAAISTLDPHSSYSSAPEALWASSQLRGIYEGIGIECDLFDDTIYVRRLLPGGPAEIAGLEPGDQILCIDSLSLHMKNKDIDKALELIRGPKHTSLQLSIRRDNQYIWRSVQRDEVSFSPIESAYVYEDGVAYVGLDQFTRDADETLSDTLDILSERGMKKLILDLRGNTGGYMEAAIGVAELFLPKDRVILRTLGRRRTSTTYKSKQNSVYDTLPMVLLMDEGSASASEIVIGALQDHDRAFVIGRRSYGKALVQETMRLIDDSELRLSVARYHTPKGRSIQRSYGIPVGDTVTRGGLIADKWIRAPEWPPYIVRLQKYGILQAYARAYYVSNKEAIRSLRAPIDIQHLLRQRPVDVAELYKKCAFCEEPPLPSDSLLSKTVGEAITYMQWGDWGRKQLTLKDDPYMKAAMKYFKHPQLQ